MIIKRKYKFNLISDLDYKKIRKICDENKKYKLNIFLKNIDKIFIDNNIPYIIYGGTLLGQVRHNDIIPWDDDIDIAVEYIYLNKILLLEKILLKNNIEIRNKLKEIGTIILHDKIKKVNCDIFFLEKYENKIILKGFYKDFNRNLKEYIDEKEFIIVRKKFNNYFINSIENTNYLFRTYGLNCLEYGIITHQHKYNPLFKFYKNMKVKIIKY